MKLRCRKTGEIAEVNKIGLVWNMHGMPADIGQYSSLAELNEEWEDYKPREPLIKNEKIRKAVRAWAEANNETLLKVTGGCLVTTFEGLHTQLEIDFMCSWTRDGVYTIEELCGEEEE